LNKLGVFGMFPTGCDWVTTGCVSGAVRLEEVSERRFCLVRALTSLSYFFAKGYVVGRGYLPFPRTWRGDIPAHRRTCRGRWLWSEKPVAWAISDNGVCVSLSRTHFVPSAAATDTCAAAPPTESSRKLRFWIISSKSRYVAATTLSDASQKSSQMITAWHFCLHEPCRRNR